LVVAKLWGINSPTIDHRGPEFAELGKTVFEGLQRVFKTKGRVVIYPASGTGAWEAALVNTLSPGDAVHRTRNATPPRRKRTRPSVGQIGPPATLRRSPDAPHRASRRALPDEPI